MRYFVIFVLLAACSSPGKLYRGIEPQRVNVDGSVFDVYRNGADVQAIRVNMEMLPAMDRIVARAISAIENATGCDVVANSIDGDQALVKARINCG